MVVGYARVSTPKQKLDRQIANLKSKYPDIVIVAEVYTGSTDNRPKWFFKKHIDKLFSYVIICLSNKTNKQKNITPKGVR